MTYETGFPFGDSLPHTLEDNYEEAYANAKQAGNYSVVGASVRGKLHDSNGSNRDDAFAARFDGLWLAVAVSDGAGSRSHSRYGASYSVNKLCDELLEASKIQHNLSHVVSPINRSQRKNHSECQEVLPDDKSPSSLKEFVYQAFCNTRSGIERFVQERGSNHGIKLDDLHCTLLGLLINTKTGEMGIGQIGDGLMLGLTDLKEAIILVEPPMADDPGASYFFTQNDWEQFLDTKDMEIEETKKFSTFYLMTDGVSNDCQYGPPTDILKRWANDIDREMRSKFSLEETKERLKHYLSTYKAKGSFDDRTLVVIYKNENNRTK